MTYDGDEPDLWVSGQCSVLLATVEKTGLAPRDTEYLRWAVLVPEATLAGRFDPTSVRRLEVGFTANATGSSIRQVPSAGERVVVVVREQQGKVIVDHAICRFMPGGSAMVVVKPGSRTIEETVDRLRALRHRPPETRPTTRPATLPG